MNDKLTKKLRKFGVQKLLCLASRRAAGVWSLLPSLAYQNLIHLKESGNIILIDFGRRNEMFEHFKVAPANFPKIVSLAKFEKGNKDELINYYQDIVLGYGDEHKVGSEYRLFVEKLEIEKRKLLLYPYQTMHVYSSGIDSSDAILENSLISIAEKYHPKLIYLTFEGQPERPIFDKKLSEDKIMKFCLNACDIILSLVRTDSITRFNEGIDIPAYLAFNPEWRSKIRLFLTRHSFDMELPKELSNFVIGASPFFDLIGQSIESGRIPWVDFKVGRYDEKDTELISKYFEGIEQASRYILEIN